MIDVVSDHDGLFCLWARLDEQTEEIGSKDLGIWVVLGTRCFRKPLNLQKREISE